MSYPFVICFVSLGLMLKMTSKWTSILNVSFYFLVQTKRIKRAKQVWIHLPCLLSSAGRPALRRLLVVLNFFHLRIMRPLFSFVVFSSSWHNPVSKVSMQFLWLNGFVFALICILSCKNLYGQVCFPNHVQSSICRSWTPIKVYKIIQRNGIHLS